VTEQERTIGFGIIGLGFGLSRLPLIQQVPGARLVAVSARTAVKAQTAADQYGCAWHTDYRGLLARDDIDVVGIYTASGQHLELAVEAARAGKHVLVTKPLEVSLERIDPIIEACRAAGVRLATEFVVRYNPANFALYSAVREGAFGKLVLGEFAEKLYRPGWYFEMGDGWRGTWAGGGGGVVVNQAIHTLDQMLWLMGDVESVFARAGNFGTRTETEDTATAVLTFKSGALGVLVGTTTFHNDRPAGRYGGGTTRRIEINGLDGSAGLTDDRITMARFVGREDVPVTVTPPARNVFEDVVRWVRDDAYTSPTLVKPGESRRVIEVVLAIYESARTGQVVTLPPAG
jgi:UDP-N-acetyl-2-amino-2-deoxyglucuronate dehydrogenase